MIKTEPERELEGYVQLFVYRIPKENHSNLRRILGQIAEVLKKHGTLGSEFYQLYSAEAFQGFECIANTLSSNLDEEVWVELDHYRERKHRDDVMLELGTDASAGALFRQLKGVVSDSYRIVMGELVRTVP